MDSSCMYEDYMMDAYAACVTVVLFALLFRLQPLCHVRPDVFELSRLRLLLLDMVVMLLSRAFVACSM